MNALRKGQKLRYEPVKLPQDTEQKAQVAVVLVPTGDRRSGELTVFDPVKATEAKEWLVPKDVSVVGLIFGPQGLSVKKLKSLMEKNEEILAELADYAEQNAKVEGLIEALASSEQSGGNLNAALSGFSSKYGVAMPKLDGKAGTDQQASVLLQALVPAVNTYDPLAPKRAVMQQSAGLAASVAGMFFGSPVGLAAGGASLFQNMRTLMFPGTEFRSAFVQLSGNGLDLCAKREPAKSRTRMAYLWAHRVPELPPPSISLAGEVHAPLGAKSLLRLNAEGAGLRHLDRAREWLLTPASGGEPLVLPVSVQAPGSALEVDLTKVQPAPGAYNLSARWDWETVAVPGTIHLHPFGNLKAAAITPATRGRLAEGNGTVTVALAGADFQFVERASVERADARHAEPSEVPFALPKGKRAGEQQTMELEIEAKSHGPYRLLLAQGDGLTYEVPFTVLPPNPKISNLPLRPNTGETEQRLTLQGRGLERLEKVLTEAGEFELDAAGTSASRTALFRLAPAAAEGQRFPLKMKVQGIEEPLAVEGAIEVAGPRPRVVSARKSMGQQNTVALRDEEVPSGAAASFALSLEHLEGGAPKVEVSCEGDRELRRKVGLAPGDRTGTASLDMAGEGMLFLSIDPGMVGQPGCRLTASVTTPAGTSDPYTLGQVVRVPRIEQFLLTDEKLGDAVYAGTLQGYDLETIEKTGWDAQTGLPVQAIPTPAPGEARKQVLRIAMPWPAPTPRAPVYVWLRGETAGRATGAKY
ncbi:MAG TPA: hypothetical protein VN442_01850 [Bryobacteraceae bacterium]|nr:hypothetical protein [Bryobacteraceae bacterium]